MVAFGSSEIFGFKFYAMYHFVIFIFQNVAAIFFA